MFGAANISATFAKRGKPMCEKCNAYPAMQATIDELVGAGNALKFHAGHSRECDFYQPIGVCDCGFADAEDHFNALAAKHKAPAQ